MLYMTKMRAFTDRADTPRVLVPLRFTAQVVRPYVVSIDRLPCGGVRAPRPTKFYQRLVLGPLWEGAVSEADWGTEFQPFVLSLRRFAPPPSQREAMNDELPAFMYYYYTTFSLQTQIFYAIIKKNTTGGRNMAVGGIVEIDLHGRNVYQAKVTIDAALRRAKAGTYRLRIIHGYSGGTALRDMVRRDYAGQVLRVVALDQGRTDLVLREF